MTLERRRFLKAAGGTTIGVWGAWGLPFALAPATCADELVRFRAHLEPLVRLIEDTPEERCIAMVVDRMRGGTSYRELLTAMFLAAIRQNHFDHGVYFAYAAHRLGMDAPAGERMLPLFACLHGFKSYQRRFKARPMRPLAGGLPPARKAEAEFRAAMEKWDHPRAERALVALTRARGARQAYGLLWHYMARDWGFIGHKPIAVASCWRTLETIGWLDAEPALRFVLWMLYFERAPARTLGVFAANLERARTWIAKLPSDWTRAGADRETTLALRAVLREGKTDEAGARALAALRKGAPAGAVWDAVHLAAAELMVRHRGSSPHGSGLNNRPVHTNTSVNALHFAFRTDPDPRTRLLNLLQAASWTAEFTSVLIHEKKVLRPLDLIALPPAPLPKSRAEAQEEIFDVLPPRLPRRNDPEPDRSAADLACRKTLALVARDGDPRPFHRAAQHLVYKTTEVHGYKFPASMFEDCWLVSPEWRSHVTAATVHFLRGDRAPEHPFLAAARKALPK